MALKDILVKKTATTSPPSDSDKPPTEYLEIDRDNGFLNVGSVNHAVVEIEAGGTTGTNTVAKIRTYSWDGLRWCRTGNDDDTLDLMIDPDAEPADRRLMFRIDARHTVALAFVIEELTGDSPWATVRAGDAGNGF